MKRCIIHIGSHKTGTTSIQFWLNQHSDEILKKGILYPKSLGYPASFFFGMRYLLNPDRLIFQRYGCFSKRDREEFSEYVLDRLANEVRLIDHDLLIISCEELWDLTEKNILEKIKKDLNKLGYKDIFISVFLRNQLDLIRSCLTTWALGGSLMSYIPPPESDIVTSNTNYLKKLSCWEEVFQNQNLYINPFQKGFSIIQFKRLIEIIQNCDLSGIDENIKKEYQNLSINNNGINIITRINKYIPRFIGPPLGMNPLRRFINFKVINQIYEGEFVVKRNTKEIFYRYFLDENKEILNKYNIDLLKSNTTEGDYKKIKVSNFQIIKLFLKYYRPTHKSLILILRNFIKVLTPYIWIYKRKKNKCLKIFYRLFN
tara:strand:- start:2700 stop:3815 length:1116 start_codon:yes stop_codon:yes gene_type:complete